MNENKKFKLHLELRVSRDASVLMRLVHVLSRCEIDLLYFRQNNDSEKTFEMTIQGMTYNLRQVLKQIDRLVDVQSLQVKKRNTRISLSLKQGLKPQEVLKLNKETPMKAFFRSLI